MCCSLLATTSHGVYRTASADLNKEVSNSGRFGTRLIKAEPTSGELSADVNNSLATPGGFGEQVSKKSLASIELEANSINGRTDSKLTKIRSVSRKIILTDSDLGAISLEGWTLDEKIGQLLLVGYRSKKQVETLKPAGLVFFSWSLKTPSQTSELLKTFRYSRLAEQKIPFFLATDHEGGRVLRLRRGMTPFPDAAAIGSLVDPRVAFKVGKAMGLELSSLGFNLNLAPVLDLGNAKSFLANRVWGEDPRRVSLMTRAFIQGLHSSRVLSVGKHFPGHGGSDQDSHFTMPVIMKSESGLWSQDLIPFKDAVEDGLPAVMTAHVEIPSIDRGPASLSKKFVTGILKNKIGFQGLIITDDFEMGGMSRQLGLAQRDLALKALKAGSDLILVVWSQKLQLQVRERIKMALKTGEIDERWLDQKVKKIVAFKKKFLGTSEILNPYWKENLMQPESLKLVRSIARNAIRWSGGSEILSVEKIKERTSERWLTLVPNQTWANRWKVRRSKDHVIILKRYADNKFIQKVKKQIYEAIKNKTPIVLVTPPRAVGSEETFRELKLLLRDLVKQKAIHSPILWAHQGSTPLKINWRPDRLPIGFVSLHSGSSATLGAFLDHLEQVKGALRASRFERKKDLIREY